MTVYLEYNGKPKPRSELTIEVFRALLRARP